jgi:hypothetical protein
MSGSLPYRDTAKSTFVPELLPRNARSLNRQEDDGGAM